ncbi:(Na+)-NQR maturation NqrM [Azovibrio restrictus]|uniref:(Na+)-NQR maturation NqrM n=1 Tax=Azovibrio restrictus TaxID=146938 RepID=UPI0026EA97DF|nr:(Na+)-NQR maturation NqrM [Azovibrio restrictus]
MDMFLITFGVIVFLVLIMAIGVMFGRKPIAGSCGGYKELDVECAAGCKNPCDRRKARMRALAQAREQAQAKEE